MKLSLPLQLDEQRTGRRNSFKINMVQQDASKLATKTFKKIERNKQINDDSSSPSAARYFPIVVCKKKKKNTDSQACSPDTKQNINNMTEPLTDFQRYLRDFASEQFTNP